MSCKKWKIPNIFGQQQTCSGEREIAWGVESEKECVRNSVGRGESGGERGQDVKESDLKKLWKLFFNISTNNHTKINIDGSGTLKKAFYLYALSFSKEFHNYDTRHIFSYNFFSLAQILINLVSFNRYLLE